MDPWEPFGFRNKEDLSVGRFFFINRGQDRFTINCQYREVGTNKNGKQYAHFRKLFNLSVTLRQPKTVGQMSLNVFYGGNIGGTNYKVLNITRNPAIVFGGFNNVLNSFILEEMLDLVERQNMYADEEYVTLKQNALASFEDGGLASKTLCDLISAVAFPIMSNSLNLKDDILKFENISTDNNNFESKIPPSFVTPLIRLKDIDSLMNVLKILPENQTFFKANINKISLDALYYLNIAYGLVDAKTQRKILDAFFEDKPESHLYRITSHSWDNTLTGYFIPKLRHALKTLNKHSRNAVLSDKELLTYGPKIIKLWLGRSKFERTVKLDANFDSVESFYKALIEELNGKKLETLTDDSVVKTIINKLNDGDIFQQDKFMGTDIVGQFAGHHVWLPREANRSLIYQTSFSYNNVNRESSLWKPLFEDDLFIASHVDVHGFSTHPFKATGDITIPMVPKMYEKFLTTLDQLTVAELNKRKMDNNSANYSFVALLIIIFSLNQYKQYKAIPKKILNLYNAGLNQSIIAYSFRKPLSEKNAKEYVGLPLEWVEKMLGVNEGLFTRNSSRF